ncbi:16S rRNA (guanine(1207)-N(2))-methyltransferase RsmC [Vibrio sp. WJH972]
MSSLTAPSQISERQLAYFAGKKVLVAGEVEDDFPKKLEASCESVTVFTTHYGYYSNLKKYSSINSIFSEELDVPCDADLLLLYWPKAKQEAQYLLAMLMAKLGEGTEVVVVGENRSGVRSIEKMFAPYGSIKKYDSARRCSFYWGQCSITPPPFILEEWYKSYSINVADEDVIVKTLPGVFSHGELDIGSRLLLDTLSTLSGKVLDFGCGAGVIGAVIAKKNPDIELSLCDVSALAIASTKATLEANHITANAFASDVYSSVDETYDAIVSNPPFHSGLETHYDSTETLLAQAPDYLTRGGQLIIVANSFLQYPPIIERHFGHCNVDAKTNKFKIYSAQKA